MTCARISICSKPRSYFRLCLLPFCGLAPPGTTAGDAWAKPDAVNSVKAPHARAQAVSRDEEAKILIEGHYPFSEAPTGEQSSRIDVWSGRATAICPGEPHPNGITPNSHWQRTDSQEDRLPSLEVLEFLLFGSDG